MSRRNTWATARLRILERLAVMTVMAIPAAAAAAAAADIELGRYLATECMTCHRSATATSTIPNIFGLPESHLTDTIKAYRDKKLPSPVMQTIAGRLSDEEIAALALYFSKTEQPK
jgi:cytochrome c553